MSVSSSIFVKFTKFEVVLITFTSGVDTMKARAYIMINNLIYISPIEALLILDSTASPFNSLILKLILNLNPVSDSTKILQPLTFVAFPVMLHSIFERAMSTVLSL